jgi:hypothetical protein
VHKLFFGAMLLKILTPLLFFTFFASIDAQQWKARFKQPAFVGVGANTGTIYFDWTNSVYLISFDTQGWNETYNYASETGQRGYPPDTTTLNTKSSVGSSSGSCGGQCSVSRIPHVMPPISPLLTTYLNSPTGSDTCKTYTVKSSFAGSTQPLLSFTAIPGGTCPKVCSFTLTDGRTFILDQSTFVCSVPTITVPQGCLCNQVVDIWILVDHSSSISDTEMQQFKSFVNGFLNQLYISPTNVNVGMSWFHYRTGVNFNITGDLSGNIAGGMAGWWTNCSNSAVKSYCASGNNKELSSCSQCQVAATATSTAIQGYTGPTTTPLFPTGFMSVLGAVDMFYNPTYGGSVRNVPKIFVTLTDGAVNHLLNENGGVTGCAFETCAPDLRNAVASVTSRHASLFPTQPLTMISMGIGQVGLDSQLSLDPGHLLILANNVPENSFISIDFTGLQQKLQQLVLLTCPTTNDNSAACRNQCGGLCTCGDSPCQPPNICILDTICNTTSLNVAASRCDSFAVPASQSCPSSNPCQLPRCNPTAAGNGTIKGQCETYAPDCSGAKGALDCIFFTCTPSGPTAGQCTTQDTSACPPTNCTWQSWAPWSTCSKTCLAGTRSRTRTKNIATNGGLDCTGSASETEACQDSPCCLSNCVGSWSSWTACPSSCCVDTCSDRIRTYTITKNLSCSGAPCEAANGETQTKNDCSVCTNRDCVGRERTRSCVCNSSGTGATFETYWQELTRKLGLGADCPYVKNEVIRVTDCAASWVTSNCKRDCIGAWTSWGPCNCARFRQRNFVVTQPNANGGVSCSPYSVTTYNVTGLCNPADEGIECSGGVPCTTDSQCSDYNLCTVDRCLTNAQGQKRCDWSQLVSCGPNLCYSSYSCDPYVGCQFVRKSTDPCTLGQPGITDKCTQKGGSCREDLNNNTGGCQFSSPVTCSPSGPGNCIINSCDPSKGTCSLSNESACAPIPCAWSDWYQWYSCSQTCAGGTRSRVRIVQTAAQFGGAACSGNDTEFEACNTGCCKVDCVQTSFPSPPACSTVPCGGVSFTVYRNITVAPDCGGKACGANSSTTTCSPVTPTNCVGRNTTVCGCQTLGYSGNISVTFQITTQPACGGTNCTWPSGKTWVLPCDDPAAASCPVPCVGAFTNWGECNCFYKTQQRSFVITQAARAGGTPCLYDVNNTQESQACVPITDCTALGPPCSTAGDCNDELACTVDRCVQRNPPGTFHCDWSQTLDCTVINTCYSSYCDQTVGCWNITTPITTACPTTNPCNVSTCNPNIGGGTCSYAPKNCDFATVGCQRYNCDSSTGGCTVSNRSTCPPINCEWATWNAWSSCSVSCGGATQFRTRSEGVAAKDGGNACPGNSSETQPCNTQCCRVDCVPGLWGSWSSCTCGSGSTITRTRTPLISAACGGQDCVLTQTGTCAECVPQDCSGHNETGPCICSESGLTGYFVTSFVVDVPRVTTGLACNWADGTEWNETCSLLDIANCPVPCIDGYTNYTECDCYLFTHKRDYFITQNASNGGTPCLFAAPFTETSSCVPAVPCTDIGPPCNTSTDCSDGLTCTIDVCDIITPPGNKHCSWATTLNCASNNLCVSGSCVEPSGCTNQTLNPADVCPPADKCSIPYCDPHANGGAGACNFVPVNCSSFNNGCQKAVCIGTTGLCTGADRSTCPAIPCTWGEWVGWSTCPVSCGGASQTRTRSRNQTAQDGGANCTDSDGSETQSCNTQCCPVDCVPGSWSSWTLCPLCNETVQYISSTRAIVSDASCGGENCTLIQYQACPTCTPIDCSGTNTSVCSCDSSGFTGTATLTYRIDVQKFGDAAECPYADGTTFTEPCSPAQISLCPVPCLHEYTNWTSCNCYDFTQFRDYTITQNASNGGAPCPDPRLAFTETRSCVPTPNCSDLNPKCATPADCDDQDACTIDTCDFFAISGFNHCNHTGVVCVSNNLCLDSYCDSSLGCQNASIPVQTVCPQPNPCNLSACDKNANGGLGACSYSPKDCSPFTVGCEIQLCNETDAGSCSIPNRTACPPIPCTYGGWSAWSTCPVTCGTGTQTRFREINQTAQDGGPQCSNITSDSQDCATNCCPVDCVLSQWSAWNTDACTCDPSNEVSTRNVTADAICGGLCNDTLIQYQLCIECDPVNCSGINETFCNCTTKNQEITYRITTERVGRGEECPWADGTLFSEPCTTAEIDLCPFDCLDTLSNFTVCDCFGFTFQTYTIQAPARNGGAPCQYVEEFNATATCVPDTSVIVCPNLAPTCFNDTDCDNGLACTIGRCIYDNFTEVNRCDWSELVVCNDSNVCTTDSCDNELGCQYTVTTFCGDNTVCTTDYCDPILGCVYTPIVCEGFDVCNPGECLSAVSGCGTLQLDCSSNVTSNCTTTFCDPNWTANGRAAGPCVEQNVCVFSIGIVAGLAGGIVAAVVIVSTVALAAASGGVWAAASGFAPVEDISVMTNPTYVEGSTQGANPFFSPPVEA